jgi:hypothetical protein
MAANVLNSGRAIEVSVYVVRAFVRLREVMVTNKEVAANVAELERRVAGHDAAICSLVEAIRQLMNAPSSPARRAIGYRVEEARPRYRVRRRPRRPGGRSDPSLTDPTDTMPRMPRITRGYGITPKEPCA